MKNRGFIHRKFIMFTGIDVKGYFLMVSTGK